MEFKSVKMARLTDYFRYGNNSLLVVGSFFKKFQDKYVGRTFNKINSRNLVKWTFFCHIMEIFIDSLFEEKFFPTKDSNIWVTDTYYACKYLSTIIIKGEYFFQVDFSNKNIYLLYKLRRTTDKNINKEVTPICGNKEGPRTVAKTNKTKSDKFTQAPKQNKLHDFSEFEQNKSRF